MTLEIREWDGPDETWDDFVARSDGGTLFHRLSFLAYHRDRFQGAAHPLAWWSGNSLKAVLPIAILSQDGEAVALSPFGASYGGLVMRDDLSLGSCGEIVSSLLQHLRERDVRRLVVVPPPAINLAKPNDHQAFWLMSAGARRSRWDLTCYTEVSESPLEGYRHSAVKSVRKAQEAGVLVRETSDVATFHEILTTNREKFGTSPVHSREEVAWLLRRLPDHVKLFGAFLEDEMIAGSLVFRVNARVLLDFYWAHRDEHQQHRPVSLLIYEITRWAARQGFRLFDFGTVTIDMEFREGPTRFKESFGGSGVFRETYELTL